MPGSRRPRGSRATARRTGAVATVLACTLAGCERPVSPVPTLDSPPRVATGEATWPFWPRDMRIHPLTRLARDADTGRQIIELRIELFDALGHTTKGLGRLSVALRDGRGRTAVAWERDLADMQLNAAHYDELTRTYLVRLEAGEDVVPDDEPGLVAVLETPDGLVLEAAGPLE